MAEEKKEYMRCRAIVEVMGKPKEHVESSIKKYVGEIKKNASFVVVKEQYAPTKDIDKMFSTFVELEMAVKDVSALVGFCFDYMPSSIEIVRPEHITLINNEISDFLNDLQARLHTTDMLLKKIKAENTVLKKNLHNSLINVVSILLSVKGKLSLDDLTKFSGMDKKELEKFLEIMVKNDKLVKEGDKYLIKK